MLFLVSNKEALERHHLNVSHTSRDEPSLTCSSRDLASSETNSGMLRVVWRPIPAGWHRSSDYARTERVERTDSY